MLTILSDAALRPDLFSWFGGISDNDLHQWLRTADLSLPEDLLELWRQTGGGDLFESETILRPNAGSPPGGAWIPGDDTHSSNLAHREHGLSPEMYVFQEGTFLSAIRLSDQKYVVLGPSYEATGAYDSLDDWYRATLRAEFAIRYGIPEKIL